jgi:hypothetical protein
MQPPPVPAAPRTTDGFAIASLTLAISGVLCFFTQPFAILFGILALVRIRKSHGQRTGKGLAIAGIAISVVYLLILPDVILPAMKKGQDYGNQTKCLSNLKIIARAANAYATTNATRLPDSFAAMQPHLGSPRFLACPKSGVTIMATRFDQFDATNITYQIVAPGTPAGDDSVIYIRCPACGNTLTANGSANRGTTTPPGSEKAP